VGRQPIFTHRIELERVGKSPARVHIPRVCSARSRSGSGLYFILAVASGAVRPGPRSILRKLPHHYPEDLDVALGANDGVGFVLRAQDDLTLDVPPSNAFGKVFWLAILFMGLAVGITIPFLL